TIVVKTMPGPVFVQAEVRPDGRLKPVAPEPPPPPAQVFPARKGGRKPQPPAEDPNAFVWDTKVETRFLPQDIAYAEAYEMLPNRLVHELHLNVVPPPEFITQSQKWMKVEWQEAEKGPTIEEGDGVETTRLHGRAYLTAAGWRELEQRE